LIDELFNFKYGELPFRSLQIKTENFNKENYQDNAVINYPAHKTMTRITEYKKMTKQNIINKTSISKEFPGEYDKKSKKFNTPFYPIINDSTAIILKKYFEETSKYKNLFLLGRLAQYKYYDMDDAMLAAFELFNKIVVKKTK
jgi:UDP-galactopyranose mutase